MFHFLLRILPLRPNLENFDAVSRDAIAKIEFPVEYVEEDDGAS